MALVSALGDQRAMLFLQRAVGNRVTTALVQQAPIGPRLQRSTADGEANQAAAQDEAQAGALLREAWTEIITELAGQHAPVTMQDGDEPMSDPDFDEFVEDSEDLDDLVDAVKGRRVHTERVILAAFQPPGHHVVLQRVEPRALGSLLGHLAQLGWPYQVIRPTPVVTDTGDTGTIQTIRRAATVTGNMNQNAARTQVGAVNNLLLGTINWPNARMPSNTSTGVQSYDLHRQPTGAGVGNTRPAQWIRFIALVGQINPFKQGHTLHQDLGGDGQHDNLSPFTASLNALHYHRAEKEVLGQTDQTSSDEYADYDVDVNYNGNPGIGDWAEDEFDGMAVNVQAAAMLAAGIVNAAGAAAIVAAANLSPLEEAAAHTWLDNYADDTFPSDIDCEATFIDDAGGGNFVATTQQQVNITNEF